MLTGHDFREEHVLNDGTRVVLRHIAPQDGTALREAFVRLSPVSRHARFHGAPKALSDDVLRYLTNVDGYSHVAIVAITLDAGAERGLGVARFVRDAGDPTVAEPAITVIDEMQHKGLGRILAM